VLRVTNVTRGTVLGERVGEAATFLTRLRGLMFRGPLVPGEGLVIRPCTGIHMFFMTFPIDAVFLDGDGAVVALYGGLEPWTVSGIHSTAACVIELPAGVAAATGTVVGDRVALEPAAEHEA
jgi:uncharacterized protein